MHIFGLEITCRWRYIRTGEYLTTYYSDGAAFIAGGARRSRLAPDASPERAQ